MHGKSKKYSNLNHNEIIYNDWKNCNFTKLFEDLNPLDFSLLYSTDVQNDLDKFYNVLISIITNVI